MNHRARGGMVEGALVLGALVLVPIALLAALRAPIDAGIGPVVLALVLAAAVSWGVVTVGLARLVLAQLGHGAASTESGPIAWAAVRVAALVLVVAPFLEASAQHASAQRPSLAQPRSTSSIVAHTTTPARVLDRGDVVSDEPTPARGQSVRTRSAGSAHAPRRARGGHRGQHGGVTPTTIGTGSILVALAADLRRRSRMWRRVVLDDEAAIDVETALLAAPAAPTSLLAAAARRLAAAGRLDDTAHVVVADGTAWLDDGSWCFDPDDRGIDVRCLVVVLGEDRGETHLALVPRGASLRLEGDGAASVVADALRVAPAIGLGLPLRAEPAGLLHALATRGDDDLVVVVGECESITPALLEHCVCVAMPSPAPHATVTASTATLPDGRTLVRSSLAAIVRELLDERHDRRFTPSVTPVANEHDLLVPIEDHGTVVRLLTAVPRVDGLVEPLVTGRERRAVELVAYLALRAGEPVTGERLRVRVLGTTSSDAAAKTLFNVASSLRRALGDGPFGPRLPSAGRLGHYAVAPDVVCDVAVLEAWVTRARACEEPDEQMAWLRAALELIEGEPFATVLEGYDWFLTEGHLTRLQTVCEDAACELVDLALDHGLLALARLAVDRALLVDPYAERLAAAAARVAAARQASFAAIDPAVRSTAPSAPVVT
ncbi:MAG TPA: hypothetical protein VMQ40_07745 [Acidimicrobiales bacterium]|nr:hypothetical protein [Acidimicrobiales bacterium]